MRAEGRRKPNIRLRRWLRRAVWTALGATVLCVIAFFILSLAFPFPEEELDALQRGRESTLVLDREGRLLRPFLSPDESWLFRVELDEINPRVVQAVVAVEDERFFLHFGVDPIAVARAAY